MIRTLIKKIMNIKSVFPKNTFKIVGISGNPHDKNIKVIYQVCGKSTTSAERPESLINELMLIKGFSKKDSTLVYDLFMTEKNVPDFKILSIQFDDDPVKFEIEDAHSKYTIFLTAEEIISLNKIQEKFFPSDLTMIYFQLFKENEQNLKNFKKSLQAKTNKKEKEDGIYYLRNIGTNE